MDKESLSRYSSQAQQLHKLTSHLANFKSFTKSKLGQCVNPQPAKLCPELHYHWLKPYTCVRNSVVGMKREFYSSYLFVRS